MLQNHDNRSSKYNNKYIFLFPIFYIKRKENTLDILVHSIFHVTCFYFINCSEFVFWEMAIIS